MGTIGYRHTLETRARMSAARQGKSYTPSEKQLAHLRKLHVSNRGKPATGKQLAVLRRAQFRPGRILCFSFGDFDDGL